VTDHEEHHIGELVSCLLTGVAVLCTLMSVILALLRSFHVEFISSCNWLWVLSPIGLIPVISIFLVVLPWFISYLAIVIGGALYDWFESLFCPRKKPKDRAYIGHC
jgi:hypothetical protein